MVPAVSPQSKYKTGNNSDQFQSSLCTAVNVSRKQDTLHIYCLDFLSDSSCNKLRHMTPRKLAFGPPVKTKR